VDDLALQREGKVVQQQLVNLFQEVLAYSQQPLTLLHQAIGKRPSESHPGPRFAIQPEGRCEVCTSAEGLYEESKARLIVKLDCCLRPPILAKQDKKIQADWLPPRRDGNCFGFSIGSF
jgi:hypothetical protein